MVGVLLNDIENRRVVLGCGVSAAGCRQRDVVAAPSSSAVYSGRLSQQINGEERVMALFVFDEGSCLACTKRVAGIHVSRDTRRWRRPGHFGIICEHAFFPS